MLWYLIIKSHADLNRIKFDLIHQSVGAPGAATLDDLPAA